MRRCPLSYEPLPEGHSYSEAGLRRLHPRLASLDDLPLTTQEIRREAAQRMAKMSIQGVQPKVSLRLHLSEGRFEVVDNHGSYILKPAVEVWPNVPENEDLTMRLAAIAGIEVPSHGLIRASDRSLAFVIRRFDRVGRRQRLALEDFAQLSGRDRDTKYESSTERLISVINQHTTFPALDRIKLFRRILFCFLTGNEDAHLKNWSLLTSNNVVGLSPAYDFVNTWIVLNNPTEELALPL
ncbi:MAG: type II toxin-antitoxin system HipA family toxin, partial [Bacteroidetes bacterium]|nr:type II toxin-antitoxin system HipA family toxin [Bacteroidota bacterium]